jgi:DNA repair exonuclease SbcCD nuclease subunit
MRILVIADTHFENKNEIETNMMCDKIYEIVLNNKPDIVVSLGDNLHTHEHIGMSPLKRAIKFLHTLSQMCAHLYVLIGNHDRPNNTAFLTEDSPFTACKLWRNITIVDKVYTAEYNKTKLAFVPYVPIGRFMEALATENVTEENINEYSIIFAHQEFKGCKMGAMLSVNGDEWKPEYPMCISGHIHDHQHLQGNILYPGTPYQISYGSAPSKGVLMVEIKDNKEISYEYYDLKLPKKMIVHLTPDELSKYTLPENCFVKLVCKGESKAIKEVTKLDSVKELLKNPRVKLAIQEDRSKISVNGVSIDLGPTNKTETIPFQKRLFDMVNNQNDDIKTLFKNLFGELK